MRSLTDFERMLDYHLDVVCAMPLSSRLEWLWLTDRGGCFHPFFNSLGHFLHYGRQYPLDFERDALAARMQPRRRQ